MSREETEPVSYTHLDVYKRQVLKYKKRFDEAGNVLKTDSNRKKE